MRRPLPKRQRAMLTCVSPTHHSLSPVCVLASLPHTTRSLLSVYLKTHFTLTHSPNLSSSLVFSLCMHVQAPLHPFLPSLPPSFTPSLPPSLLPSLTPTEPGPTPSAPQTDLNTTPSVARRCPSQRSTPPPSASPPLPAPPPSPPLSHL